MTTGKQLIKGIWEAWADAMSAGDPGMRRYLKLTGYDPKTGTLSFSTNGGNTSMTVTVTQMIQDVFESEDWMKKIEEAQQ